MIGRKVPVVAGSLASIRGVELSFASCRLDGESNRYLFTGANPIGFVELDGHAMGTVMQDAGGSCDARTEASAGKCEGEARLAGNGMVDFLCGPKRDKGGDACALAMHSNLIYQQQITEAFTPKTTFTSFLITMGKMAGAYLMVATLPEDLSAVGAVWGSRLFGETIGKAIAERLYPRLQRLGIRYGFKATKLTAKGIKDAAEAIDLTETQGRTLGTTIEQAMRGRGAEGVAARAQLRARIEIGIVHAGNAMLKSLGQRPADMVQNMIVDFLKGVYRGY